MRTENNKFLTFIQSVVNSRFVKSRIVRFIFFVTLSTFLLVSAIGKNVEGLGVFHAYTFGMVFGYTSYLWYFIMFSYGIWLLIEVKVSRHKRFYYEFTGRIKFVSIVLFVLMVALFIQFGFDAHVRKMWFGFDHGFFVNTKKWHATFTNTTNSMFPNTNIYGMFWAVIYDLLCLTGSNITPLIVALLLVAYLVLIGVFKKPFTLLFNKEYKLFNKWLANTKVKKSTQNKQKVLKNEENAINEISQKEEAITENKVSNLNEEQLSITKEVLRTEVDIDDESAISEEPEKSYTSTFSFTQEISNAQNTEDQYSVEFELTNNPFWEKKKEKK
ncbi:Uncharacterised protein [Mycoplasmopsis californica]|uniref:Uncharacterized protein n=1 Tax=Mycoplasmopsis equigenitalium TaxID=114883 RepID=A0ABY5J1Q5_9BACT|nr:hypothetical protein [Mycoplasmopsis equigenitalium]UUD37171.1 hypothetical protein NPA09_01185 [Mycoplasmopsis equigenitalium]VEU69523.1 Uncharacterised protein [Mycoplasmopsis californica]